MSDNDLKTLREHNVHPGDVVQYHRGPQPGNLRTFSHYEDQYGIDLCGERMAADASYWRVISRANADPAIDLTANRMAFGLLDDATKAAFEAHVAAGGKVERYTGGVIGWFSAVPAWSKTAIYRTVPKPTRGEVVMHGVYNGFDVNARCCDTHRLTLPTSDGALICGTYTGPDGAQVVIAEVGE